MPDYSIQVKGESDMSSFFNEKLIAALKSGKYYCEKCGSLMEFENEEYHDVLICPSCGAKTDIEDYGFTDEKENRI